MVVVDTSVFSLYLRRDRQLADPILDLFLDLFEKDQIVLLGPIYQELLSGIRHATQFERLADTLSGFDVELATLEDHRLAAQFYNSCRAKGVQGASLDFLICAMSQIRSHHILTLDNDFTYYDQHLPITLLFP